MLAVTVEESDGKEGIAEPQIRLIDWGGSLFFFDGIDHFMTIKIPLKQDLSKKDKTRLFGGPGKMFKPMIGKPLPLIEVDFDPEQLG